MALILVIEDDATLREIIDDTLQLAGFETLLAADGAAGVDLALQHKPDLVVSDIMMPIMDGYGVLSALRANEELRATPIIFLTAKVTRDDERTGMASGADDYITKPFTAEELVGAVNARLKRQSVLMEEVVKQTEELGLLRQLDQELSYRLDPKWVTTLMMDWVLRKTNAKVGIMGIFENHEGELKLTLKEVYGQWKQDAPAVEDKWPFAGHIRRVYINREPLLISNLAKQSTFTATSPDMISLLCLPISSEGVVLGVIILESPKEDAFAQKDLDFLRQIANRVAIALEHAALFEKLLEQQRHEAQMREVFGRFVSPAIAEAIQNQEVDLEGEIRNISMLFCDIRGFTSFCEKHTPKQVVALLNDYLPLIVDAAQVHGGTVNKFGGDSTLVIYGAPAFQDETAYHAVLTALHIQTNVTELNRGKSDDEFHIRVGVGVNTGEVIAGAVGPKVRQEYTVIGDTVNLASRIEGLNKDFPEYDVFISQYTYEALGDRVDQFEFKDLGTLTIRGKSEPVRVWGVLGFREN